MHLTRRRGGAEKDAEKKREGWKVAGSLVPLDGERRKRRRKRRERIVSSLGGDGALQAVHLTRRRGGAEKDAEKKREGWVGGAPVPCDGERRKRRARRKMSELRSDGKLKHAPPMRRSRLKMAKLQGDL